MKNDADFIQDLIRYYGAFDNKIAVILPIANEHGDIVEASMAIKRDDAVGGAWISVLAYNDRFTSDRVIEQESMARALDAAVSNAGFGQIGGLAPLGV